jgi:hypothetical protein
MNVQMWVHVLRTFMTHLLVHIHQKKKITAKIASVFYKVKSSRESKYFFFFALLSITIVS